jgi:membrane fusion protein (multidrug efflux system)
MLAAALLLLAGCDQAEDQAPQAAPAPTPAVGVVAVKSREVTPSVSFTGRVEAVDKVDLRARVEGFLEQRHFAEGQDVKEGDLLFTIEKGRYQAAVAQAEANVARAQAALSNAELQLARANELVKNRNIPQATRDDREAERDAARAELAAAQAALQTAQLNLSYTEIKAPISGRIGASVYSQGNLVGPASGVLATIVSQDPIYVTFPVSSRQLLQVREQAAREGTDASRYQVKLRLPDGSIYDQTGTVDFVGVQVDPSTDTVTVRATFPNPRRLLVAGGLVGVLVETVEPEQALVIPQAAVLTDQAGPYVLLVDGQSKIEQRRVQLGQQTGAEFAVEGGLRQGDRIVTEGLMKVRPGQTVQVVAASGAAGA